MVDRWWPHTHGAQPLYEVWGDVDGRSHLHREDRLPHPYGRPSGRCFRIEVNGEPIFCRGATWMPIDPVTLVSPPTDVEHRLALSDPLT